MQRSIEEETTHGHGGLLATLNAKAGKEDDLASFLDGALPLAQAEDDTIAWFAIKIDSAHRRQCRLPRQPARHTDDQREWSHVMTTLSVPLA